MQDILDRLRDYNPVDRTTSDDETIAGDIHAAAAEIERLRSDVNQWQTLANQGIHIEAELRKDNLFLEREIERLNLHIKILEARNEHPPRA